MCWVVLAVPCAVYKDGFFEGGAEGGGTGFAVTGFTPNALVEARGAEDAEGAVDTLPPPSIMITPLFFSGGRGNPPPKVTSEDLERDEREVRPATADDEDGGGGVDLDTSFKGTAFDCITGGSGFEEEGI